ncbi:unnamed protein product, partial [Rotaria sp. Silwood2]
MFWTWGYASI